MGWGIQFQHAGFLIAILLSFVVYCLVLLDIITISPPQKLLTFLDKKTKTTSHHTNLKSQSFFSGLLAVVMATPCSAPFIGTAITFALQGSIIDIIAVFIMMGLGLALPFIIAAFYPPLLKIIPKPGKWMLYVKSIFAFLFLLATIWVLWLITYNHGNDVMIAAILFAVALVVMLLLKKRHMVFANNFLIMCLVVLAVAMPSLVERSTIQKIKDTRIYNWQDFNQEVLQSYRQAGKIVFVDVTADWCITCQFNKQHILHNDEIIALFKKNDIIMMQADWSLPNNAIAQYIQQLGRFGIPVNVLYKPNTNPILLSEILTKSEIKQYLQ